jgi:hypothetical protein
MYINRLHILRMPPIFYDKHHVTLGMFNIRYYPNQELTQNDASQFDEELITILDAKLKNEQQLVKDYTVLEWIGTKKNNVNNIWTFVTEYRRTSTSRVPFCVRLVRVFSGKKSFTVTVSYREDHKKELRQICDNIIESISIPPENSSNEKK